VAAWAIPVVVALVFWVPAVAAEVVVLVSVESVVRVVYPDHLLLAPVLPHPPLEPLELN
jgi:hypothetical protein